MIGIQQLRAGVYDLLQKVRGKGKAPITSNLPSENFSLGRGSKRLAGTGRTAGIKARKLEQQGVAGTAESAKNILVGGNTGKRGFQSDLTFLKNAMGDGVHFCIEKGGSARANLLSQKHLNPQRKKRKLLDAAATRVGTSVSLLEQNEVAECKKRQEGNQERRQENQRQEDRGTNTNGKDGDNGDDKKDNKAKDTNNGSNDAGDKSNSKSPNGMPGMNGMDWLENNISRSGLDRAMEKLRKQDIEQEELLLAAATEEEDFFNSQPKVIVLSDYIDRNEESPSFWDENTRKVTFQSLYKQEIGRQVKLLQLPVHNETTFSSPTKGLLLGDSSSNSIDEDDRLIAWEDG